MASEKNVLVIQRVLPHYRVIFFDALHRKLARSGISLSLAYGDEYPGTVPKTTRIDREWAHYRSNRYLRLPGKHEAVWQGWPAGVGDADLVVIEQANRLLLNYLLLAYARLPGVSTRLAFWGHGEDMQAGGKPSLRAKWKRSYSGAAHWWFAYTDLSSRMLAEQGYPEDRITTVNNAIDTDSFQASLAQVGQDDIVRLRREMGARGSDICLYCGGLYQDKRLSFLFDAARRVRSVNPEFELVIIGDGPDRPLVERYAAETSWVHYVGPRFGKDRARYFRASTLLLMPGAVGLAVIDSFVARVPMITTDIATHGPEIAYLEHGANGMMAPNDPQRYAQTVNECLSNEKLLTELQRGCERSARSYTLENMVERFAGGIEASLAR
jgi:glycosyltransferase involved in cell wall biosynthesis